MNKICTKCKIEKSLDEFSLNKRSLDKKCIWCKTCEKNRIKKYREEHKDKYLKYREENKDKIKIKKKIYNLEHKEDIRIQRKKYYQENKDKIKIQGKKYREEHKEDIKKQRRNYINKRRKIDVKFKITINLRTRILDVIKGNSKSLPTMMLIGCEIDYLMFHLQSQFKSGMSWDNHGRGFGDKGLKEWHIDHIRPCVSFDLSKPEEQQKCFHYTNLQPLWAEENLIKNGNWS